MGSKALLTWLEQEGLKYNKLPIDINYGYKTGRGIEATRDIKKHETIIQCKSLIKKN